MQVPGVKSWPWEVGFIKSCHGDSYTHLRKDGELLLMRFVDPEESFEYDECQAQYVDGGCSQQHQ